MFIRVLLVVASIGVLVAMCTLVAMAYRRSLVLADMTRWEEPKGWHKLFIVAAGIGLAVCIHQGVETMLFWIPGNWGKVDSDGEFQAMRTSIAALSVLLVGGPMFGVLLQSAEEHFTRTLLQEQVEGLERLTQAGNQYERERVLRSLQERCEELERIAFPNGASAALIRAPAGRRANVAKRLLVQAKLIDRGLRSGS